MLGWQRSIDNTNIGQRQAKKGAFTELKASTDPVDEHGVGDRGFNDARYTPKNLDMAEVTDPAINAAVTTAIVDAYGGVIITLTGAGNAQTLQDPTDATKWIRFTVVIKGAFNAQVNGITMTGGEAQKFIWDGASWVAITAIDADDITATPHGDIVAVKVQSYLDELEDEKLAKLLAAFTVATELTIAEGAVTITQSMHKIDTQSDDASDDLDTINGGSEGALLIIRAEHTDRTIVLKDSTGNLDLWTGDIELDETNKYLILTYDGTLSKWVIAGGAGLNVVSDAVYDAGWNGVTKRAPSKNSVYDEMEKKVERIVSVDNEIARFDSTGGDVQGYSSNAPIISDDGLADFPGGLKVADPTDEHGVGDQGYYDNRYGAIVYNDIGVPGRQDFGIGICPLDKLALVSGMTGMTGHTQSGHGNHGNYQFSEGSVMGWVPRGYYKVGTGSNGLAVNIHDVKSIYDFPDTEIAIAGMTRANPCVVTAVAHGRSNGDYIWVSHITAQAEWKSLSGKVYKVAGKTDDTFELTDTSDANIDTSGYGAAFVPASDADAKTIYNEAMANGYAWFRADIDGGKIQPGQFADKYMCSKKALGAGYVASSIKNGLPLSSAAAHNPIADLTACNLNHYYQAINAAHARDGVDGAVNPNSMFFAISRFIEGKLAFLSRAHGDASKSTAFCAWYDATDNFPKGCNNALSDTDDGSVLYTSDGYSNCGKTGSGTIFAKTTHNGQDSGIADLNGLMYEVNIGLTCIAPGAHGIEAITSAATPVFTWTGHGLNVGDYIMILAITQADWTNFKDKIWKVATVPDANTFTLTSAPDTSGYGAYDAGTDPGTLTKGTFYLAKEATAMKDFDSGNAGDTDHWGATGVAAMMDAFTPAFESAYPNNGFSQRFGSGANQVLSEDMFDAAWLLTGLGFPKDADGIDVTGTNAFGKDYFYQYIRNELCGLSCGPWAYASDAGVWCFSWSDARTNSTDYAGFRLGLYTE